MAASERDPYYVTEPEAAELFGVDAGEMRSMINRGALEARYAADQWWIRLGPRGGGERRVALWHGTTRDRAEWIADVGFQTLTQGRQTWFTAKARYARRLAVTRAQQRHGTPYVIGCEIDLELNPVFWMKSPHIYVFHEPLGVEVIRSVDEVDAAEFSPHRRKDADRGGRRGGVGVEITRNSGPQGVLFWINEYRAGRDLAPVAIEDDGVDEIVRWVAGQYEGGREDPIPEEELAEWADRLVAAG